MARVIKSSDVSSIVDNHVKTNNASAISSELDVPMKSDVKLDSDLNVIDDSTDEFDDKELILENENIILLRKIEELESQLITINKKNEDDINSSMKDATAYGVQQGREDYLVSVSDKLNGLDGLLENISSEYKNALHDSTDDLIEILFSSVVKIISKEYSKDILLAMVNDSIKELAHSNDIILHVSSDDLDYFDNYEFPTKLVKVCVDSRVLHGGCIIETSTEKLDFRLDKKIEIFKSLLLDAKSHVS